MISFLMRKDHILFFESILLKDCYIIDWKKRKKEIKKAKEGKEKGQQNEERKERADGRRQRCQKETETVIIGQK